MRRFSPAGVPRDIALPFPGPCFIPNHLLTVANKRGKVFAGFNRNVEAAEAGARPATQRKRPKTYGLATEAGANLIVSGRTLGQRSSKARRNNEGEMVRGPGPADPYASLHMTAARQSTLNFQRPGGVP